MIGISPITVGRVGLFFIVKVIRTVRGPVFSMLAMVWVTRVKNGRLSPWPRLAEKITSSGVIGEPSSNRARGSSSNSAHAMSSGQVTVVQIRQ